MTRNVRGRGQADWLLRQPPSRSRRWALEVQLFGSRDEAGAQRLPECRPIVAPSGDPSTDESYALAHCHDFLVLDARGRRGFVSDVRFRSRVDRPDELEIAFGRFRRRVLWVPVGDVQRISFERREVVLSSELPVSRPLRATRHLFARRHVAA